MDCLKEQRRAEPHKAIWRIADDVCGSVGGWGFTSYRDRLLTFPELV